MQPMIRARDLTRVYHLGGQELRALDGVDLDVGPNEFVALVGPSGSGKSTLMHVLGLLDQPDSGSYQLLGQETAKMSEDDRARLRSRTLGFVFQQFNLLARTSATENVALPRLYHPEPLRKGEAEDLLKQVGLGERLLNTPAQLSGGQQQRVAIARSLLNRPKLLFADEPTGNLDSKSSLEIMKLFTGLNDKGIGVVLVTHEPDIAAFAQRVITLRDGKIVSDKSKRHSAAKPAKRAEEAKSPAKKGFSLAERLRTAKVYFAQALRAMLANRLRTALSMLGILIGVAAVVAMLAIGAGASKAMEAQLSSLGSNLLLILPGASRQGGVAQASGTVARFQADDAAAVVKAVPSLVMGGPEIQGRVQVTGEGKNANTMVVGAVPAYAQMRASDAVLGRFFTDDEVKERARVAVVGVTVSRNLFGEGNPVGKNFKMNRVLFQVIGVLPAKGSGSGFRDEDDKIVIPVSTAQYRVLGRDHVDTLAVEVAKGADMDATQAQIKAFMRKRLRIPDTQDDTFNIFNLADIQNAVAQTTKMMSLLLASVAGISLLVGGVGIMNILLVSVTERTREIGLRKALGARQVDILAQFLIEAVAISLLGGLAGLLLGMLISALVSLFAGWSSIVTPGSVALAVGFSTLIGVIFGYWPAKQAAALDPITALRYE
jgi:macrolide transport system ATP-binding/permease protein